MKKLVLLFMLLPFTGVAQKKGIYFEQGLSWAQVKEKAQKENKFLFVDCFTTWCTPCKYMDKNIFPQEKVGDFFNKNFVNIKVQFNREQNDSEQVKKWYADAEAIAKEFDVGAYPTFLIFSPQGDLVHRIVGGGESDVFIAKVQKALNPETQYYTLLKKNQAGNSSPELLREIADAAKVANNPEIDLKYTDAYLATQTDLYTRVNLDFLIRRISNSKSRGFKLLLENPGKVDALLGTGKVKEALTDIIIRENISFELDKVTDIDSLIATATAKYPGVDIEKPTQLIKVHFYLKKKNWDQFRNTLLAYMTKYSMEADGDLLNFFAWKVLENYNDADLIMEASKWSKRSVDEAEGKKPEYLNTYATLLYKSGRKEDAIPIQQKALYLAPADKKNDYQDTLEKMKKGL